jgi:hypothetical protein
MYYGVECYSARSSAKSYSDYSSKLRLETQSSRLKAHKKPPQKKPVLATPDLQDEIKTSKRNDLEPFQVS